MTRTRASVLVGLLWCLAILSVVVIGVLHTARIDLQIAKNYGDTIQAHYLALAGIEKAKALIYQDAMARRRAAKNHTGALFDAPEYFRDVPFGRGQFRVFRQGSRDEGGKIIYGISDEESRLNVNQAQPDELAHLYNMTPGPIAAILDWRDSDNAANPNGAEAEYYASLQPPYLPRNGPFQTIRELLMVAGMDTDLFTGEDVNLNGLLDPEEDDGDVSYPRDNHDGILDAGWSGLLTVDSSVRNENAAGQDRVNIQTDDENTLAGVPGISSDLAKAIVAYRGQNKLESLADLLDVTAMMPQDPSRSQPNPTLTQPGLNPALPPQVGPQTARPSAQPTGPKLVSQELLMDIADDLTAGSDQGPPGAININTASAEVLACLPGVSQELAQAIVSYRKSTGFFPNIAWLLKVDGINQQLFKQIAPKVTARSETFRILSEGKVNSSGARKRIQVIVRLGASSIETLSYREDL